MKYISGMKRMCKKMVHLLKAISFFLLTSSHILWAQDITGVVKDANGMKPIPFVNIGIVGKNLGTVSDHSGRFRLSVGSSFDRDSLLFSVIGYEPQVYEIGTLRKSENASIIMHERDYKLDEVTIKPAFFKERILGITSKGSMVQAGFHENKLGYEYGLLMKVKKTAYIKQVQINIASCTYDTVFFRLNVYEVRNNKEFVNILKEPIYINLLKEDIEDEIHIDLRSDNIVVEGEFLVTLEHVKDLGYGSLYFSTGLSRRTYYRMTSQGKWVSSRIGIAISVLADVEK